jgi:serine/threonine-protein kinase
VKGKLSYMSPEQTLGGSLDLRADLFAVGVMLWEAGAGMRLWPGESARSRLRLISLGEIPPFEDQSREHAELWRICRRALDYAPARRYRSGTELEAELEALRATPSLHATRMDVAAFMAQHFGEQRRKLKQLLETELGQREAPVARSGARPIVETTRRIAPMLEDASLTLRDPVTVGPRAPRKKARLLVAGAALLLTPPLALAWKRLPVANSTATPSAASAPSIPAREAPSPSPSVTASASVVPAPPPSAAAVLRAPAPVLPGAELTRPVRTKRVNRVLDTSDPWAK